MPRKPRRRAHAGDGSVFQREDGKWVAQISHGGRGDRKVTKRVRASQAAALEELRRLRASDPTVRAGDQAPRLDTFLATWLASKKRRVRATTYTLNGGIVRLHIVPELGEYRIDRITPVHVTAALRSREAKGDSPRVRELMVIVLRQALDTAAGDLIAANPAQRSHRPRVPRRNHARLDARADARVPRG